MAVLSLVGIDAKQWEPLAVLALAGVAGYFLWQHLSSAQAGNATQSAYEAAGNTTSAELDNLEQLAVLQAIGGTGAAVSDQTGQVVNAAPSLTPGGGAPANNTSSQVGTPPAGSI